MSQSFIKETDNGSHSALAGLGVLRAERPPTDPLALLRRIVAWRDSVSGGVVRGADLETLIDEARGLLTSGVPEVHEDWMIDHSTGRPILTYKRCSVIEAEQAEYVMRLVAAAGVKEGHRG